MRLDRHFNAVIETQEEKEIIAEAVKLQIAAKRTAAAEAERCCETGDADILESEIWQLYDVLTVLNTAIEGGAV